MKRLILGMILVAQFFATFSHAQPSKKKSFLQIICEAAKRAAKDHINTMLQLDSAAIQTQPRGGTKSGWIKRFTFRSKSTVILDINLDRVEILVKKEEFDNDFRKNPKRNWGVAGYNSTLEAWSIGQILYK